MEFSGNFQTTLIILLSKGGLSQGYHCIVFDVLVNCMISAQVLLRSTGNKKYFWIHVHLVSMKIG